MQYIGRVNIFEAYKHSIYIRTGVWAVWAEQHRDMSSAYFFLIVDLRERGTSFVLTLFTTLQMFADKRLISYYFCMLLLHIKMCKLFKGY